MCLPLSGRLLLLAAPFHLFDKLLTPPPHQHTYFTFILMNPPPEPLGDFVWLFTAAEKQTIKSSSAAGESSLGLLTAEFL
jgi:hypothetical protein